MNYSRALAWLYGTQLHGIKLGLDNVHRLLAETGWDARGQKFIHVAGTNGKGSVCAMMDAILREDGKKTGLFTSPHLITFRERIRINGEMISEEEVCERLTAFHDLAQDGKINPTFFEITTALALGWFQKEQAEVVVLETGMGGRLDATNVVTPVACAITPVDFDHMSWLGDTLDKIAAEKAGIIKQGVPVVSAPQSKEAAAVLRQTATEKNADLRFIEEPLDDIQIALAGSHQKWNAALAVETLRAAQLAPSPEAVWRGLRNLSWPGRFQQLGNRVVLDGAHNESSAKRLAQTWREIFGDQKATLILGVARDKDINAICRELLPLAGQVIVTTIPNARTATTGELQNAVQALAPDLRCEPAPHFADALASASAKPRRILVTGSLFLVGEALSLLQPGAEPYETSRQ